MEKYKKNGKNGWIYGWRRLSCSRPATEVKQRRARLVLGWVTAWKYRVPQTFQMLISSLLSVFCIKFLLH